jgi:dTDP-4-dehydrorhamnose 3,5-epimerase
MAVFETSIRGLYKVELKKSDDERGSFCKPFQKSDFEFNGLTSKFTENFYSISKKGVLRGMHFQAPPHEHVKFVFCSRGRITDVVLDLRLESPTYGNYLDFELSPESRFGLYIPIGCAHGFYSTTEDSIVNYMVTAEHCASHDTGIRWDSFGYKWPETKLISERDRRLPTFFNYESPFVYG